MSAPDWSAIIAWFGDVPRFHDCEVVSIDLRRDPEPTVVRLHAFRMSPETDDRGYYKLVKHALVTFRLSGIIEQDFAYWNHQNALDELTIEEAERGHRVVFHGTYGIHGEITAKSIGITLDPIADADVDKTLVAGRR
jgi:immunity protein 50 of polymorphic toxin system